MHSLIRHQLTRGPARASPGLGRRCGRGPAGLSAHSSQEGHGLRREGARRWLVLTLQEEGNWPWRGVRKVPKEEAVFP